LNGSNGLNGEGKTLRFHRHRAGEKTTDLRLETAGVELQFG
jgi:hypothetical protein